jgi:hypothetical protein
MDERRRAAAVEPPGASVRSSSELPRHGGDRAGHTHIDDRGAEAPLDDQEGHAHGRGAILLAALFEEYISLSHAEGSAAVFGCAHSATPLRVRVLTHSGQDRQARARLGGKCPRYRWNDSAETGHDHS